MYSTVTPQSRLLLLHCNNYTEDDLQLLLLLLLAMSDDEQWIHRRGG